MVKFILRYLYVRLPEDIQKLEMLGFFESARRKINEMLKKDISLSLRKRLEYELERIERIFKDYNIPEQKALEEFKKTFPDLNEKKFYEWINKGYIDFICIEGKKFFFSRFIHNLLFLCKEEECKKKKEEMDKRSGRIASRKALVDHITEILNSGKQGYIFPRTVRAKIKVSLKPGTVPEGEIVRCWLPFPQVNELQQSVKLISCYPKNYTLAPENYPQRTIYFEQKVKSSEPLEFMVEFEYTVHAFHKKVNPNEVKPYDEESEIYQKYTREQLPHIPFTRFLKNLAREIVGDEENPYLKAKKIYDWLTKNLTYTYVAEYSTYECIPEFVARNLRGDCGFQALLFITLCRIVGVPSRWQSGWYANPASKAPGPHDWAQFYIEPYGWLYADLSFGRRWRELDPRIHEFYFGNIDSFRTVFNSDIMSEFEPAKKFIRSDPVDNQRGELEFKNGNIYYDKFEYEISYSK